MLKKSTTFLTKVFTFLKLISPTLPDESRIKASSTDVWQTWERKKQEFMIECNQDNKRITSTYFHVVEFSDLVELWVIKRKSPWSFAHVERQDHVNSVRNADHVASVRERFVYSIVKIARLHDYQMFDKFTRCAKVCGLFSWLCWFGWAGEFRSHGWDGCLRGERVNHGPTREEVPLAKAW